MATNEDRVEYVVLGRVVGTVTGWDDGDHEIILYNLVAAANARQVPDGDVTFDFELGLIKQYDEAGNVLKSIDMITALLEIPRKTEH